MAEPQHRPSATGKERIAALDGLRAVALLIIMGYHFGVGWLQGGFFSLDIFYVLSGYLITGLLLSEFGRRSRIKLSAFWLRRARRLLPALLIVLVVVTLFVRFIAVTGTYPDYRMSALSALFYFSNWWQIGASGNYFAATGAISPLTHTWSLAVEEQFYLVWPLVVVAVMGLTKSYLRGIRALLIVSVAGAAASALEMALLYRPTANTTRLYFGTDTHAQSILIGCAMACVMTLVQHHRGAAGMAPPATSGTGRRILIAVGLLGFAGTITLSIVLQGTSSIAYRGGFAVSALSAAAIIIGAVCVPGGPIARVLSVRPLVWLGTISYGAYLWHFPVYIYVDSERTGLGGLSLLALRFACTVALAAASFYLVERPVMYGHFWRSLRAVFPAVALMVATVAVIVAGTVVSATASVTIPTGTFIPAGERQALLASHAFSSNPVRFQLFGDSIALTMGNGLAIDSKRRFGVTEDKAYVLGCTLNPRLQIQSNGQVQTPPQTCLDWPSRVTALVDKAHPAVFGILLGRWESYNVLYQGHWTHLGEKGWDDHLTSQLNQLVRIGSSRGAKVVLFTMPYVVPPDEAPSGGLYPENQLSRVNAYNAIVRRVAKEHPGVASIIDLNHILDPSGHYTAVIDGVTVRWADGVHISVPGAAWLQPRILPAIAQLGLSSTARTS